MNDSERASAGANRMVEVVYQPNFERLLKQLHVKLGSRNEGRIRQMLAELSASARPRGVWRACEAKQVDESGMMLDGISFVGPLFREHIQAGQTLYPYLVTCGSEAVAWFERYHDNLLLQYWAEAMMEDAMYAALDRIHEQIAANVLHGNVCDWNPGSLPKWPLEEQRNLFSVLGNGSEVIGVTLTEQLLMLPQKSLSGICFLSQEKYESCSFCARIECPSRRVPMK